LGTGATPSDAGLIAQTEPKKIENKFRENIVGRSRTSVSSNNIDSKKKKKKKKKIMKCKLGKFIGNSAHLQMFSSYPAASLSIEWRDFQITRNKQIVGVGGTRVHQVFAYWQKGDRHGHFFFSIELGATQKVKKKKKNFWRVNRILIKGCRRSMAL
jgi:hypothetical protein